MMPDEAAASRAWIPGDVAQCPPSLFLSSHSPRVNQQLVRKVPLFIFCGGDQLARWQGPDRRILGCPVERLDAALASPSKPSETTRVRGVAGGWLAWRARLKSQECFEGRCFRPTMSLACCLAVEGSEAEPTQWQKQRKRRGPWCASHQ